MTVSTNPINSQGVFIRTSRNFPQEAQPLAVEVNRSYVDIANHINFRTIGIFPTQKASATGESWYTAGTVRQQTLRQVYIVTGSGNIPHGIVFADIVGFTRIYGAFKGADGNFYPLPYVDPTNATNQISLGINGTNIVVTAGGGAPPIISTGYIVLEWLSNA